MKAKRNVAGFTLLETLLAVAIIIILASIAFVGVISYQRTMERLELDATAKEIYIAAQNHLTMANGLGLLTREDSSGVSPTDAYDPGNSSAYTVGGLSSPESDLDIYHFVYPNDAFSPDDSNSVLGLMLPFGSIDETVRKGYSYIIRYQRSTAHVLDVFCAKTKGNFALESGFSEDEYTNLLDSAKGDTREKTDARKNYGNAVIGWYGDISSNPVETGKRIEEPKITVHNEEKLWIEVDNPNVSITNAKCQLSLIVIGKQSNSRIAFQLLMNDGGNNVIPPDAIIEGGYLSINHFDKTKFKILFDDVTQDNKHFSQIFSGFIPGEDITVEAIAFDNTKLTNIASSGIKKTNSLFASARTTTSAGVSQRTVSVSNFRHFENLDPRVSSIDLSSMVDKAYQTADMDWKRFLKKIDDINDAIPTRLESNPHEVTICYDDDGDNTTPEITTEVNKLLPVISSSKIAYDGRGHKVSNIDIRFSENAGLFGLIEMPDTTISNLEIVDATVQSSDGNAGTLVGSISGKVTVSSVLVHNTNSKNNATVTGATAAGGIVGKVEGNATITGCAAAVVVSATDASGVAGGLVGSATNATIENSYAGGHTTNGAYVASSPNVSAAGDTGVAGGLVGKLSNVAVSNSYSTCSVKGNNAGGFVGTSTNSSIDNSYAMGLVTDNGESSDDDDATTSTLGAFAASVSGTKTVGGVSKGLVDNLYFAIINNTMQSVPNTDADGKPIDTAGITKIDETTGKYEELYKGTATAVPYDSTLAANYNGMYPYMTVEQLIQRIDPDAVGTWPTTRHYGDWPSPETLVYNSKN